MTPKVAARRFVTTCDSPQNFITSRVCERLRNTVKVVGLHDCASIPKSTAFKVNCPRRANENRLAQAPGPKATARFLRGLGWRCLACAVFDACPLWFYGCGV